jgi:hypothetical protein
MAQLARLNGMALGMNPPNMDMLGMANLSVVRISPEAQLLALLLEADSVGLVLQVSVLAFRAASMDSTAVRGRSISSLSTNLNGKSGSSAGPGNGSRKKDEHSWLRMLTPHEYTLGARRKKMLQTFRGRQEENGHR